MAGRCPAGRFGGGLRGLGDVVAAVLARTGVGPLLKRAIADVTRHNAWLRADGATAAGGCRCEERRRWLNRLVPLGIGGNLNGV
jgi:hypothetical protein